jgi:hypothetical protein
LKSTFVVVAMVVACSAQASEFTTRTYDTAKQQPWFQSYVLGVGTGYSWANTELSGTHRKLLYCQPKEFALTEENYLDILEGQVKAERAGGHADLPVPLELLLLKGLERTFPCK